MGRLPVKSDFPSNVVLTIVPPPNDDKPTNILVLLHGLGDTQDSFVKLGKQLNLPETACVVVQGPQGLLDLGGFHWGDDIIFDSNGGGLDADAGFRQSTAMLKGLVEDDLIGKCEYEAREIMVFGFGQGGMAALNLAGELQSTSTSKITNRLTRAVTLHESSTTELSGVISIGAGLPASAPAALVNKCKTPILVRGGSSDTIVTSAAEEKLKHNFEFTNIKKYRRPGDGMPNNRDEMMPIMQFFSRRLRSTKGVPDGSVEL